VQKVVFVGSGIFKSGNPEKRANAIVKAVTNYTECEDDPQNFLRILEKLWLVFNEDEIELLMAESEANNIT